MAWGLSSYGSGFELLQEERANPIIRIGMIRKHRCLDLLIFMVSAPGFWLRLERNVNYSKQGYSCAVLFLRRICASPAMSILMKYNPSNGTNTRIMFRGSTVGVIAAGNYSHDHYSVSPVLCQPARFDQVHGSKKIGHKGQLEG